MLMKKIRFTLLIILVSFFGIISSVCAKDIDMNIKNIEVTEKSDTVEIGKIDGVNNTISSEIIFNKLNDYIVFEVTLKNSDNDKYKISSIVDNNSNNNILIEYKYDKSNTQSSELKFYIKMSYKNQLINKEKININDLDIKVNLVKDNGSNATFRINNPATGDNIVRYITLFVVSAFGIFLVKRNIKLKSIKLGSIVLLIAFLMVPFTIYANENFDVGLQFNNIVVAGEFEKYVITIDSDNGDSNNTVERTYGEALGDVLPTPYKNGYKFKNWINEDKEVVTKDTIVTKEMYVKANYTINEYTIKFDANGGIGEMSNQDAKTGKSIKLNKSLFIYPEHSFAGWNTKPDGSGDSFTNEAKVIDLTNSESITLYAMWNEGNVFITYNFGDNVSFNGSEYLDTDIRLFSDENLDNDFDIAFNIESITPVLNQNNGFNTIVSCMDETADPFPGFLYRYKTDKSYYDFTGNASIGNKHEIKHEANPKVDISKEGNILTYNGETILDYSNIIHSFDTPVTFGSSLNSSNAPYRFFNGTISTATVKVEVDGSYKIKLPSPKRTGYIFNGWSLNKDESDNLYKEGETILVNSDTILYANWTSYDELAEGDYTISYNFGDVTFDGTNYLDTGIKLFSSDNVFKNFDISFSIEGYEFVINQNENHNTVLSAMDESGQPFTGFVFRRSSNNSLYTLAANVSSNKKADKRYNVTDVNIYRDKLKLFFNGEEVNDFRSLIKPFDYPLTFGASLNSSFEPFRYFKGTLKNLKVNVRYFANNEVNLPVPSMSNLTFAGWSGDNGDLPEQNVKVESGNITDKTFTANFINNQ